MSFKPIELKSTNVTLNIFSRVAFSYYQSPMASEKEAKVKDPGNREKQINNKNGDQNNCSRAITTN